MNCFFRPAAARCHCPDLTFQSEVQAHRHVLAVEAHERDLKDFVGKLRDGLEPGLHEVFDDDAGDDVDRCHAPLAPSI